jgi:hypothetical protein
MPNDLKDEATTKEQIKSIVLANGVDEDAAVKIADKCYEDVYYRPFGGAKSFAELDEMAQAQEFAGRINIETYKLESIINNIISDDGEESPDARVEAIKSAADEYRNRVSSFEVADKSILDKVKNIFTNKTIKKEGNKWVLYTKDGKRKLGTHDSREDALAQERAIEANKKSMPTVGGFKVYVDDEGQYRWLSLSSNAFEDLEKELFTTKALEEAIEYADKSGERGPLLVYHIPSAEIGHADFQAMAGRFLVESGTFDDTPMGNKAREYFVNSDEDHQVSIGYQYHDGDERDGQYDWLRIEERSVLPMGMAANPWTSFKVIGEGNMDAKHTEMLEKVFGKELTSEIITTAEEKTKELEQNVRFKERSPAIVQSLSRIKALVTSLPDTEENKDVREQLEKDYEIIEKGFEIENAETSSEEAKEAKEAKEVATTEKEVAPETGISAEQLREVATLIAGMAEGLEGVKSTVNSLQEEVKAMKATDDEKIANIMAPRTQITQDRPTNSDTNVIDENRVKEIVGAVAGNKVEDPAQKYVDDLLKQFNNGN